MAVSVRSFRCLIPISHMMSTAPHLEIHPVHDEIIVTMPGFRYSVTYYKPDRSPQLMARNIPTKDDPATDFTASEFLEAAWWLANEGEAIGMDRLVSLTRAAVYHSSYREPPWRS
jgi:hypothetical protein